MPVAMRGSIFGGIPMNYSRLTMKSFYAIVLVCLLLSACGGDTPWRYSSVAPDSPVGLAATADNGQVSLSWPAAKNAAAYNIYYATATGVARTNGTKIATVVSTSYVKTGLTNNTTYYFVITAVNSGNESSESNEVAATPELLGSYAQGDVTGSWNFHILVSGAAAGWMRGKLTADTAGAVTFNSFLDSAGNSQPPANLFPALILGSGGQIRDAVAAPATFQGVMASSRKMIVGTASLPGNSRMMAILQKQVAGITFSNSGDLQGFGNSGGGGRRFSYSQIASGFKQEWEFAEGQIGRDQKVQYTTFIAPSNPVKPGDKASILNITADGIVTESLTAATPQPATVIDRGTMSADKSLIIGTATDTSGASPRYILRIYQIVTISFSDPNTFSLADLGGSYDFHELLVSANSSSASGSLTVNAAGGATFSAFADSNGATILPADFSLSMAANGNLSTAADPSLLGKLAYFKELFVLTGTASGGDHFLRIALKR